MLSGPVMLKAFQYPNVIIVDDSKNETLLYFYCFISMMLEMQLKQFSA